MGCVSSQLLNQEDDFTQIGSSAFSHHIVSLTSTTYGLLTLDPSSSPTTVPPTPPPRFTTVEPRSDPVPEVINSWELMAGLDSTAESFRFAPQPSKPSPFRSPLLLDKENLKPIMENSNPNHKDSIFTIPISQKPVFVNPITEENSNPNHKDPIFTIPISQKPVFVNPIAENSNPNHKDPNFTKPISPKPVFLNGFDPICPPKGENKIVIYTTSLRGVRRTFEDCNAVRAVFEGFGVFFSERDISMDRGFRDELWELMKGKDKGELVPPRVFVKGRYVGGVNEVLKIVEEGYLGHLVEDLPIMKAGYVCEVCGGVRFLPCLKCNGSCKIVMVLKKEIHGEQLGNTTIVKCSDCNENGLVRCSVCS